MLSLATRLKCVDGMQENHDSSILATFSAIYIVLQALAIPGPIILSLLSGALYPKLYAQALVAACATSGATICFCLSYVVGRSLMEASFSQQLQRFREQVRLEGIANNVTPIRCAGESQQGVIVFLLAFSALDAAGAELVCQCLMPARWRSALDVRHCNICW